MPERAGLYFNLFFFGKGKRGTYAGCVKILDKISHPILHKIMMCNGLFS